MNEPKTSTDGATILITPRKPGLRAGRREVVEVLIRVQAPDPDPARASVRPPLNLALVLDRSGSMDGRPLEEAKRSAIDIIDGLLPTDRLAVVAYDDEPTILVSNRVVGERSHIRRALLRIRSGGCTNLFGGWEEGTRQLEPSHRADALSRILLLSDGEANRGLVDPTAIADKCAEAAARGIATSTYGLGHSFNERLMTEMARAGRGAAWYGETATDLREPFRDELALLDSTWATDVTLAVLPADGAEARLRNDCVATAPSTWRLPDIVLGSEAWALLEVSVPVPEAGRVPLLALTVAFHDRCVGRNQLMVESMGLPVMGDDAWNSMPEDELVVRRSAEIRAGELQDQARAAVARGEWNKVDLLLEDAKALAAKSPWVKEVVGVLSDIAVERDHAVFSKEAMYSAMKMKSRLAAKMESANLSAADGEPGWLRRKVRQGRARS